MNKGFITALAKYAEYCNTELKFISDLADFMGLEYGMSYEEFFDVIREADLSIDDMLLCDLAKPMAAWVLNRSLPEEEADYFMEFIHDEFENIATMTIGAIESMFDDYDYNSPEDVESIMNAMYEIRPLLKFLYK